MQKCVWVQVPSPVPITLHTKVNAVKFMSLDGNRDSDASESLESLNPATEVSNLYKIHLREVLENYVEVSVSDIVIHSDLSFEDYKDLYETFEGHRFELHRILSECYTFEYPEVCNVASALVLGIADALFEDQFELYQISGTYDESEVEHYWSLFVSRANHTGYIVDLTYVQFLSGTLSEYQFIDSKGNVHRRMGYENFKQRLLQDLYSVDFPPSVIPLSDDRSTLWHPLYAFRVI